jgi:hypothetical protein
MVKAYFVCWLAIQQRGFFWMLGTAIDSKGLPTVYDKGFRGYSVSTPVSGFVASDLRQLVL